MYEHLAFAGLRATTPTEVLPPETADMLAFVGMERVRQNQKWGVQRHPDVDPLLVNLADMPLARATAMARMYGVPTATEAKEMCEEAFKVGAGTYAHILNEEHSEAIEAATIGTDEELLTELIQVAAVAVAWAEQVAERIQAKKETANATH